MHKLEEVKSAQEAQLAEVRSSSAVRDIPCNVKDFSNYRKLLSGQLHSTKDADLRNQILKKLVQKVEVTQTSFKIHYFVGQQAIESFSENTSKIQRVVDDENKKPEVANTASGTNFVFGSNRVVIGELVGTPVKTAT